MPTAVGGSSSLSGSNPYESLIQRTLQIEAQPKVRLENKREQRKNFSSLLDDFDSKLSALHSQLQTLTDSISSPFDGKSAQAEEGTEAFSVSASDDASLGTHTLTVDRLASNDGRVSKKYSAGGTDLRSFFDTNGEQTFSIEVATPTDDNPDARTSIDVTVNPDGSTDEEILGEIRSAIDDAMQSAVDDDTIDAEERANASVVNETSDTARLSLRSGTLGYQGRLSFTDSADGLLSTLEVNASQLADNTNGGMLKTVGSDESSSKLTSQFDLDGLTLYRNDNRVTDALEGVTIDLEEANGNQSSFEVSPDSKAIIDEVGKLLEKYNEVIKFLREKSDVDGETGERGEFAGERTFSQLQFQLRNDAIQDVSGLPEDTNSLRDVGIEIGDDGTLSLEDEDALRSAMRDDSDTVKQLFAGDDGIATNLETRVNRFVETGGVIDQREDSVEAGINRLDDRIDRFDRRLQRREEQLRERFTQVQKTLQNLQGQQQSINSSLSGEFF